MQKSAFPQHASEGDKKSEHRKSQFPSAARVAFTPGEFAAGFGRSETWGYRQLYSGRVKAIHVSGRLLIPKSEIDRLLAEAAVYDGIPARAPKAKRRSLQSSQQEADDQSAQ
jgi:hypothetical protein